MTRLNDASVWHRTICPACGYPSTGICAACSQGFPAAINLPMTAVAGVPDFDPNPTLVRTISQTGDPELRSSSVEQLHVACGR